MNAASSMRLSLRFFAANFFFTFTFAVPQDCGPLNIIGHTCYQIDQRHGKVSYFEGKSNCAGQGGSLVAVDTQNTLNFVSDMIGATLISRNHADSMWIGGALLRPDGNWALDVKQMISNRAYYGHRHVICPRLEIKSRQLLTSACSSKHYAICQYAVVNCSLQEVYLSHVYVDHCESDGRVPFNTTLSVHCIPGYMSKGPPTITCHANGSWTQLPNCLPNCPLPSLSKHISIYKPKDSYGLGDELLLICNDGYFPGEKYLKSHQVAICGEQGHWKNIKEDCTPEDQLNCPSQMCRFIQIHLRPDTTVVLNCTWRDEPEQEPSVDYHFHWLKNHERVNFSSSLVLDGDGNLAITAFQEADAGMYTCVRGWTADSVDKITVYDVKVTYLCQVRNGLPVLSVAEGDSVYLSSKGDALAHNVAWFKDGERVWGDKRRIILPTGDLLIRLARPVDHGFYSFEVENDDKDLCTERSTKVTVVPSVESICGLADSQHKHPWLVALWWEEETEPFCYGTLVDEYWVVTSSFCLARFYRRKDLKVTATLGDGGKSVRVERFLLHPLYSKRLNVHDVAIVKLAAPVIFTDDVRPICIAPIDWTQVSRPCDSSPHFAGNVSGFGALDGARNAQGAMKETLMSVGKDDCQKHLMFELPETMFCAQLTGARDAVYAGDTGSPFEVQWKGRTHLYGVYSWGTRMSQVGLYDYFTKIPSYYGWIRENSN